MLLPIAACSNRAANAPRPRYAVLRFENLSGDPALDWTGRAISVSLPFSFAGTPGSQGVLDGPVLNSSALDRLGATFGPRPASAPGISSERAEALVAGATRTITGYVARNSGQVRITATVEDLATGRTLRTVTADGVSPMAALNQLAHRFSAKAGPLPTSNPEAMRSWADAVESPPAQSTGLLQNAVRLDPDFGVAWVSLAALDVARGDRAAAGDAIETARGKKLDQLSQADLTLLAADMKADRTARLSAMRRVSSLSPADSVLLRELAGAEVSVGEFAAAASDWKKVIDLAPGDPLAWNSLGYARSYAGDYAGALAALREYQRLRPKDANPSDSIGDLNYSFRKFSEAAVSYLDAHARQPGFEEFGDLYKAAWAKFRAGDKPGADKIFAQFRMEREKQPGILQLLNADWLYRTGREREGIAALRKVVSENGSVSLRIEAYAQVTIWDLMQGDREQAAKDAAPMGAATSSAPIFMARFAALPSAPAAEWEARAEKIGPPSMASLRRLALGYALLLDGKREAALPVWKQIVNTNPATDFFARAIYARLQGLPLDHPLMPDPANLNQFQGILDRL